MSKLGRLVIKRLTLTDTGTHNDPVSRPYSTHVTAESITKLQDKMNQGFTTYNEGLLSGIAGNILQPAAAPDRILTIDNGWGTKRLRFHMVAGYVIPGQPVSTYFIYSGYTSHHGISMDTGAVDPNMRMYINNAITVTFSNSFNGSHMVPRIAVTSNNQIIHHAASGGGMDISFDPTGNSPIQMPATMRPSDLTRALANSLRVGDGYSADSRTGVNFGKSNRDNNLTSRYLAKSLTAINYAQKAPGGEMNQYDMAGSYEISAGMYCEASTMDDPLIGRLDRNQMYTINGWFDIGTLRREFPETNDARLINYYESRKGDSHLATRGQTESWVNPGSGGGVQYNASLNSIIATQLINALPSVMIPCLIASCKIEISNMHVGYTGFRVVISDPFALIPEIPQNYLRALIPHAEQAIHNLIVNDLAIQQGLPLRLDLQFDVFGDAHVAVGVNSYSDVVPFTAPMFADSMFPPIITTNNSHLNATASDIEYIVSTTT